MHVLILQVNIQNTPNNQNTRHTSINTKTPWNLQINIDTNSTLIWPPRKNIATNILEAMRCIPPEIVTKYIEWIALRVRTEKFVMPVPGTTNLRRILHTL